MRNAAHTVKRALDKTLSKAGTLHDHQLIANGEWRESHGRRELKCDDARASRNRSLNEIDVQPTPPVTFCMSHKLQSLNLIKQLFSVYEYSDASW